MALVVAFIACSKFISLKTSMTIGLVFEVLGSYGIAFAEFPDPLGLMQGPHWMGLSWVAAWTMLFTVVVPTAPKRALIAALLSVSAVPVVVTIAARQHLGPDPGGQLFFTFIFPYLLIVLMAYVGSHVVYGLGKEVSRARELGSYVLVEKLGQGGMGEVWRAKHRLLARPAAIKLIRPALTGAQSGALATEIRRRFELEAQTISRLRSPHTVDLYDFGVAEDGAFYYVMELLDGLDADSLVRRDGPMPPERVIAILRQICHSLSEAEANGLVHRDIKPANIFLCRYGEDFDFVKVLDFGIVKAAADDNAETPHLADDRGEHRSRNAGVHRAGAGVGGERRRPRRHLLDGLRGVLAADRRTGVHRRDADGPDHPSRAHAADADVAANRSPDSGGARGDRHVVSREGSGPAPADGAGAVEPSRLDLAVAGVDAGTCA